MYEIIQYRHRSAYVYIGKCTLINKLYKYMRLLRTTVTAKSNPAQVFSGAQHSDKVLAETSDPAAESHVAPVEPGDSAEEMLGGWSLFSDKP
jgi:hypothetical protein